jgi:hypothetical protein
MMWIVVWIDSEKIAFEESPLGQLLDDILSYGSKWSKKAGRNVERAILSDRDLS